MDINVAASQVALVVHGETSGSAPGHASFSNYVNPTTAASACGPNGSGLNNVGFSADFDNSSGPALVDPGTYSPPSSSGTGTGKGAGTSPASAPPSTSSQPSNTNSSANTSPSSPSGGSHKTGKKNKKGKSKKGRKNKKHKKTK